MGLPEIHWASLLRLPPQPGEWTVYLLRCADGSLYCGITKNPLARWQAHCHGRGARYTRSRSPQEMRLLCGALTAAAAAGCEYRVKRLRRTQKQRLWQQAACFQAA